MIKRYPKSWERMVSDVLSPPIVWAALAFPLAFSAVDASERPASWAALWAALYALIVCLLPILYIAFMVRRGKITDVHMEVRQQRIRPFLVSMLCTAIGWAMMHWLGAPPMLPLIALFTLIQLTLMLFITLVWQISMHTMSISGAVIATGAVFGLTPALVLLPLVPLVAAARLRLQRHTPAQLIAGTVIGAIVPLVVFSVFAAQG
ncbi:MAG: hypothetical protein H7175_28740 [Burkholderiales bacterium]|nr:hypothetical protein [Anaerolineae bacterium]